MPDTTSRQEAAVDTDLHKSFEIVLAEQGKRQRKRLEGAICDAALNQHVETDALVPHLDHAISVWNSTADEIDSKFGKGFFGVRMARENAFTYRFTQDAPGAVWRASNILDYLSATEPRPVYKWMSDLLFMSLVSEKELQRQAGPRNSFWDRVLRKRKVATAQKRAAFLRDQLAELEQDQNQQRVRIDRTDLRRRHAKLESLIRQDPTNGDVAVGWPHGFRVVNPQNPLQSMGMLVPLSRRHAQGIPDVPDEGSIDGFEIVDPATK